MERLIALALVALCALQGCACTQECDFEEHVNKSPAPLLLSSALEPATNSDPNSCRARCCERADCDAAVLGLPMDGPAQCFLLSCGGACTLQDNRNSQFQVFTRKGERAPKSASSNAVQVVPLMMDVSTRTGDNKNSTFSTADCLLPSKVGLCKAAFPRFFYDAALGSCRSFVYGGCGGNGNNFDSKEECEASCRGVTRSEADEKSSKSARMAPPPQTELSEENDTEELHELKAMSEDDFAERCGAEAKVGPCRGAFPRWFFNKTSGRCQKFTYGGCRGNKNNYEAEDECSSACAGVTVQRTKKIRPEATDEIKGQCELAPESGRCRASFTMFYFDPAAQRCKTFIYGGCGGNNNRYSTEQECVDHCVTGAVFEGQGKSGHSRWTAAFFLFLALAAISFLLLTALIFITLRRNRQPRRTPSVRSDKEELLPDSSSVDSLPLPESPTKA